MGRTVLWVACLTVLLAGTVFASCVSPQNPIEAENCNPGSTGWDVSGSGDSTIQGFATDISVNLGQTINFKVNTNATAYNIEIYRMGYYGGTGARLITTIQPSAKLPQSQPACLTDSSTFLLDCGNWAVSGSWTVPTTATSGLYFADLVRTDTGGASQIFFVVRNDASHSDILVQTSDDTWQAYNPYGGHSLYGDTGFNLPARAFKVSYNRPFATRNLEAATWLMSAEYPMIRWLEANGYDVSYSTGVDAARNGTLIQNHKVYLSVGHDEYWSKQKRASVEAARDAGVNLAFFSGNEVFWKTRWENSIDGSSTPYRTLVCYKETLAEAISDPLDPPTWTGTWRDPTFSPPADGGRPENALTGTLFKVNGPGADNTNLSIQVPAADGKMRFWRGTAIAGQSNGQTWVLPGGTLGYEWDVDEDNGARPAGTFRLSTASYNLTTDYLLDWGGTYGAGTATHHLTLHRAPSGALVFGAGTVQWSWGLDANHDGSGGPADINMQQATVNLFADMGVQPATIQSGLLLATKSTDTIPPASTITSPPNGSQLLVNSAITVSGTAADTGGGVVGGVEVSVDGGTTWHPANGRESWSYTWTPTATGSYTIHSRATDDSANIETPSAGISVSVATSAQTLVSVTLNPTTVSGGSTSQGTVNLGQPAASGGVVVTLSSSNTSIATVPSSVTVPAGSFSANFTVNTSAPSATTSVTISAVYLSTKTASLSVTPVLPPPPGMLAIDAIVSKDQSSSTTAVTSPAFSTAIGNELLLAFVSTDANSSNMTVTSVSGAGLTWNLVVRANAQMGTSEIWRALAPTALSNVTVTANLSQSVDSSLTIMSFAGVDTSGTNGSGAIGATTSASAASGAPTASLTTSRASSWVLGVGNDWDNAVSRTLGPTQSLVHQYFPPAGDTYWVQMQNAATPLSGTLVTINDTAPTSDRYNLAIAEVRAAPGGTFSISGTITNGAGATVALTGSASATVTADASGNFSFTSLPNGSYTVTPSKSGFIFTPASQSVAVNGANVTGVNFTASAVYSVSGSITPTANGSGSTVTLTQGSATIATVTADTNGNFTFNNVLNGSYTVTPSKSGFVFTPTSQAVTVNGANVTAINFTIAAQTWTVSGTITPAISGASVALTQGSTTIATATPDASGNFSFSSVANGSYTVTPSATGYIFNPANKAVSVNGANVSGIAFTATAVYSVSGNISPATLGTGSTVTLTQGTTTIATATADGSGNFIFNNVVNGTYTVTPSKSGVTFTPASQSVNVSGANLTGVAFTAAGQTFTISGTISPSASGSGATVTLTQGTTTIATATADVNGNYTLAGATNGSYTVTPSKAGFSFSPASQAVSVNGANLTGINFTANALFSISGSISPAATGTGATVTLSQSTTTIATAIADASGNFAFSNIVNGSYTVTPSQSGVTFTPTSQAVTVNGANVTGVNFTATGIGASCPCTIWPGTTTPANTAGNDAQAVELGVRFRSDVAGFISGIRFYKSTNDTGTHTGSLWTNTGTLLATATFSGETASGWQQVSFAQPVAIAASTTYVASYHLSAGNYTWNASYFATSGFDNPPLHALGNGVDGANGVYIYGASAFPTNTFNSTNYWVDVVFTSGQTYSIAGTITGAGGAGATVTLSGASSATVTADASGNFSLTGLANGSYTVTPSKTGYTFTPASQNVGVNGANVTGVNFTSAAQTYSISGTISGAGGIGATVSLGGTSTATTTADASGNYTFTGLANGSYTVTPSNTGFTFSPSSQAVTVNNANLTTVNFTTVFSIAGTISGAGGSAATVTLSGTASATTTADAFGNYSFAGLANGSYSVTPSKSGYTFTPTSATVTINNASVTGVNFTSAAIPTYSISGTISGAGGSAATVSLTGAATATTTADASGNYAFTGLANGSYTVTPGKSGYAFTPASASVTVNNTNVTAVNFSTAAVTTFSISGTITGTGGNGATVTLGGAATATVTANASGAYAFTGLANGAYTVTPSHTGFIFTPANQAVTVAGANVTGVNFTSTAKLAIDKTASTDRASSSTSIVSPTFTTTQTNELLLAFISSDAKSTGATATAVSGGGLTWTLVKRTNTQLGTAEIWRAFSPAVLTNASVTATLSQKVAASLTVVTFTGVDTSGTGGSGAIGATGTGNASSGAPTASLTTTRNNSWVFGVGTDWDHATARTLGPGQTMVHQYLATTVGDTYWVQSQTSTTPFSGTVVTINDTAPTSDRYDLSIVEVLPAL